MQNTLILVGLMGAGKSTVGRQLAQRLGLAFYDSDKVIEERTGASIPTIFSLEGESGFREREEQIIAELCTLENVLIATGGGSVLRETNRKQLRKAGYVVYLRANADHLYQRIKHDKSRPLMQTDNPLQTLRDLLRTREPYYLEVADIGVQTGKQKVSVIVREIERKLKQLQDVSDANA